MRADEVEKGEGRLILGETMRKVKREKREKRADKEGGRLTKGRRERRADKGERG